MSIRIKVVNRTRFMLTDVKYALNFCQNQGEGVHRIKEILPNGTPLELMDKYSESDEDAEHAIRFSYEVPSDVSISDRWLEFSIHANHEFSNTSACTKQKYLSEDLISGIFETGISMKILVIPDNPQFAKLLGLAQIIASRSAFVMLYSMRIKGSRLKSFQNKKLLDFFVAGIPARTAAELVGVNRNTANLFYNKLGLIIVHFTERESPFLHGEVEVDESYFGGIRQG